MGGGGGDDGYNPMPRTLYLSEPANVGFNPALAVWRCYPDEEIQELKVVPHLEHWLEQQFREHVPHGHPKASGLEAGHDGGVVT